ncbi:Small-conductance mechanosensitive channel [Gemmobacter aquatilis]|uniref:Small-conductance mechanosensitive channel n=1 Tax=Gemmobacter aquatilis TaxID=933059 RepID=A0A1H8BWM1_9RHOB|nr:DUF3772 domain-containing protein [Gemmobacter aquatilis]SEM87285.1 Small-conductance mechanosensitive channel [Gemmobacter aquatilis]
MSLPRSLLRALAAALCLALAAPLAAQTPPVAPATGAETGADAAGTPPPVAVPPVAVPLKKSQTAGTASGKKSLTPTPNENAIDYAAWEQTAQRAEVVLATPTTSNNGLELLRGQLVVWRSSLQQAQSVNASRITSLREQIAALGDPPAEGATEPDEIANRRKVLTEQLGTAEAPRRAAEEAYRRASGLIGEIDTLLRERQAAQMLKLWPTPLNPANWGDAAQTISATVLRVYAEVSHNWNRAEKRLVMIDSLPVIGVLFGLAILLIWRGRGWIERFALWLQTSDPTARWRRVFAFIASLGQIVVPTGGVVMVSVALILSEMTHGITRDFVMALPGAGFTLFAALWLAGRVFPKGACETGPLALDAPHCAEGRLHTALIGAVLAAEQLRHALIPAAQVAEAAVPVLSLPLMLVMALLLWRVGHLLNRHVARDGVVIEDASPFRNHVIRIIGKALIAVALVGPLLAVIGYTSAASALIFPAAGSLGLVGLLLVLVQLISDIYRALIHADSEDQGQGLLPVLAGFVLTLGSLPFFALIWGARREDLGELWNRFTEGFQLGDTRISPSNFLYFLVLFAIGLTITRMFQGALRSSVLPKTKLDQGGRNAIISGTGYIGIFIAGIVAFSAAGIDLSGLAIVASALSLGIGFGLQNIVQNFVSGVILLIERPVSEGDWIEVGGVSGTVKNISVRSTRIQTFDRSDVIVPNADLVSQQVTNWTRFNLSGRLIIPVGVDYSSDTRKVAKVLQEIAEAQPMALLNPPPVVAFMGLGVDALNFEIRMIIRDVNFSLSVRSEVNHQIVQRFHEEGISMPFSQRDIWLRNPEAVAAALTALQAALPAQPGGAVTRPEGTEALPLTRDEPHDHLDTETEK